jgi:hypothetical protein
VQTNKEKNKEERKKERRRTAAPCCDEPAAPASPPSPGERVLLTFPTAGKIKTWDLIAAKVAELQECFPSLDVLAEARKALGWINANRPKTAKGMTRFLFSWMARANDSGPRYGRGTPQNSSRVHCDDSKYAGRDDADRPPPPAPTAEELAAAAERQQKELAEAEAKLAAAREEEARDRQKAREKLKAHLRERGKKA